MPQEESSPAPPGFTLHQRVLTEEHDNHLIQFYLPTHVTSALDKEALQRFKQRVSEARAREREEERLRAKDKGEEEPLAVKPRADANAGVAPAPVIHRPLVAGEDYDPRLEHPAYAPDAPSRLTTRAAMVSPDKELRKRDEELGRKLASRGILRRIAASDKAIEALSALRTSLPHFGDVIELVRNQLLLATRTRRGVQIPPILLDGEPGIGKTHFAHELGKALGTTVRRIAFDSAVTGATLMGSDRRWSNTQHGILFDLICLGEHANPIVILDEIDKAAVRSQWDPLAPLHTLLEPSTATQARDISVDFEFDVSRVTWVATSNSASVLLPSLRSRFREFHLQRPGAAEAIQSATAVIGKAFEDLALTDFEPPGKPMAVALAHLSAREVRQALEQAIAHAVANQRSRVTAEDLPLALLEENDDKFGNSSSSDKKSWLH